MSGVVPVVPRFKFTDANGNPLAFGSVTVYAAGTTTKVNTYQDAALTTANTNPVNLDANGECLFWTDGTSALKFLLTTGLNGTGSTVSGYPVDNIPTSGHRFPVTSLSEYGTTADGGLAMQRAIDALGATGGAIIIPRGSWTWGTVPKLPNSLTGKLTILGYGATIVLTAGAPRVFDLDKTADNQTFQNFHVAGFKVDASAASGATGANHVLVGSRASDVWLGRFNADNWLFEDIELRSVPQHAGSGTVRNIIVFVSPFHAGADEATQNTLTNITFRNVKAWGGDGGFLINAFHGGAGTSANVYLDDINLINCAHYLTTPAPNSFTCSHIHIGGYGFGDRCRVDGFVGTGSGDNCVEINAMQSATVDDLDFEGFVNYGLYTHNYHVAQDVDSQRLSAGKHSYRLTFLGSRAFSFGQESTAGNAFGNFMLGTMSVHADQWRPNGTALLLLPNGAGTKTCRGVQVESLTFTADLTGQVVGDNYFPAVVSVKLGAEVPVDIGSLSVRIYGAPTLGGANNFPRIVELQGNVRYTCRRADINCEVAFANLWFYQFNAASATIAAKLTGHHLKSSAVSTTSLRADGAGQFDATHWLQVSDSQLVGTDLVVTTAAQNAFIRFHNVTFGTAQAVSSSVAGASPHTFSNGTTRAVLVALVGGTVSNVEVSNDEGGSWTQIATATGCTMVLFPRWQARVTHTVAPTRVIIPYPG